MASKHDLSHLQHGNLIRVNGKRVEFCGDTHSGTWLGIDIAGNEVIIDHDIDTIELISWHEHTK